MTTIPSAARIEQLKREAKKLVRATSLTHSEALDRLAGKNGFTNWSLLAKHAGRSASASVSSPLAPSRPNTPAPPARPTDPRQRYYLHGDQYEPDPSRYYCAQCDVFFAADHFAEHGPHTGERYLAALERWKKRDYRSQMNWRREDTEVNLLAASALAARAQYQSLRPAFSDWLLLQRKRCREGDRRDSIGFMIIGLLTSRGLPKTPKSLTLLRQHYERHGAQHFELEALEAAWAEFSERQPA